MITGVLSFELFMNRNNTIFSIAAIAVLILGIAAWWLLREPESTVQPAATNQRLDSYSTMTSGTDTATALSPTVPTDTPAAESSKPVKNNMHLVTISTNFGDIQFETYDADAPKTVKNFITLADKGYYNGLTFHRIIAGFMIQGGDPTGNGSGGPGYQFEDELNPNTESYKKGYARGTVAMANAGPNTNGSQFFIMHEDYPLPNNYTIFGHVVKGMDVVDKITDVKTGANDRPVEAVIMQKVMVTDAQ
jgi:cyclophilin family peptidyl-prolyl cis-trans isomerase